MAGDKSRLQIAANKLWLAAHGVDPLYQIDRFFQSLCVHGTSRGGPSDVRESSGMVSADVCSAITEEIISPSLSPFGCPVHCASRVADRLTSSALG